MKKIFLIFLMFYFSVNIYSYGQRTALRLVKKYQAAAQSALDELDTEKAKKNLLKAISLIEKYKLKEKEFANIYISAGVLNLMIEDGSEAVNFFKKALALDPDVKIPENFSSDDVDDAFEKAKESMNKEDESFTFDTVSYKIIYNAPKTHYVNKPLKIKVKVQPVPPKGYDIQVMYMSKGSGVFESLRLVKDENNYYVGEIPALSIPEKKLKMYILMIDDDLNPVTMFGSESEPLEIRIIKTDEEDLDLDEEKKSERKIKKQNENKTDDIKNMPFMSLKLETGTGFGIAHGKPEFTSLDIEPGLAWSPSWVSLDASFYVKPKLAVGFYGRYQNVEPAWSINLKGQMLIYLSGDYRLFADFGMGYGTVKYRVDVSNAYPEQGNDVVIHGDIFFFGGLTFVLMFNNKVGVSAVSKVSLIVPKVSVLMDLGAGLYLEF